MEKRLGAFDPLDPSRASKQIPKTWSPILSSQRSCQGPASQRSQTPVHPSREIRLQNLPTLGLIGLSPLGEAHYHRSWLHDDYLRRKDLSPMWPKHSGLLLLVQHRSRPSSLYYWRLGSDSGIRWPWSYTSSNHPASDHSVSSPWHKQCKIEIESYHQLSETDNSIRASSMLLLYIGVSV